MSEPSEKHTERATLIYDMLGRGSSRDEEIIARALAEAEREGMRRAAEIALTTRMRTRHVPHGAVVEVAIAHQEVIADAILSEAGWA